MGRKSEQQQAQTRQRILSAAEQLFAEKGYAHTQIAEIAASAAVGIGSFYRQFPDKEAVLQVILTQLFGEIRTTLLTLRAGVVERTPLEQLVVIQRSFEAVFELFATHPAVTLTMLRSGYGMTVDVDTLVWDALSELADDVARDVSQARCAGLLTVENPRSVGDAIVGMILQLAHRMLVDGDIGAPEAANFCTRFTIGGLLAFVPREIFEQVSPLLIGLGPPSIHQQAEE